MTRFRPFRRAAFRFRGVVLTLLACCACGGGGGGSSPDAVAIGDTGSDAPVELPAGTLAGRATIGPEGGTVAADPASGREVALEVPAGALSGEVEFRLYAIPDPEAGAADPLAVTDTIVRIEPEGTVFATPAVLTIGRGGLALPASQVDARDVDVHRLDAGRWVALASETAYEAGGVRTTASLEHLSSYGVRVLDPYAAAPRVDAAWAQGKVVGTAEGPIAEIAPGMAVTLAGEGFGYDRSRVQVLVDGAPVALVDEAYTDQNRVMTESNRYLAFDTTGLPGAPVYDNESWEFPVVVSVDGRQSNAVAVRMVGNGSSVPPGIVELRPPAGRAGDWLGVFGMGIHCGLVFRIGGVPVEEVLDDPWASDECWCRVPAGLAPGPVEVVAELPGGGATSNPASFRVYDDASVVLSPGPSAGGVWSILRPENYGNRHLLFVLIDQDGWVSYTGKGSRAVLDLPWGPAEMSSLDGSGQPEGRGSVSIWLDGHPPIPPGTDLPLRVEVAEEIWNPSEIQPGTVIMQPAERVRTSNTIAIRYDGRVVPGGTIDAGVGPDMPAAMEMPVGDFLCLQGLMGEAARTATVPALLDGPVIFGGMRIPCFEVKAPGSFAINDVASGATTTVTARYGGALNGSSAIYAWKDDPEDYIERFGIAGFRVTIPPGTVEADTAESIHIITLLVLPTWLVDASAHIDPAFSLSNGLIASLDVGSDVKRTLHPITVEIPYDPAAPGKARAILQDPNGVPFDVPEVVDEEAKRLVIRFPAREWGWNLDRRLTCDPDLICLPSNNVHLFEATNAMGAVAPTTLQGALTDGGNHFRVDYVPVPGDPNEASEDYARSVLDALVAAWDLLAGLGWTGPAATTPVAIRSSVSWADMLGGGADNKAATSVSAWDGSATMAVRNDISGADERDGVLAHEVGHMFQRQIVSGGLAVSWWDEAAAEWVAWRLLGTRWSSTALMLDEAAVRAMLGTFPADLHMSGSNPTLYGLAVWPIWLSQRYGDDIVRRLFLSLAKSSDYYWDFVEPLGYETGESFEYDLLPGLATDFWMQRMAPFDSLSIGSHLATVMAETGGVTSAEVKDASGATLAVPTCPQHSSIRVRIDVPPGAGAGDGDTAVRAAGLGSAGWVGVFRQDQVAEDVATTVAEVGALDTVTPGRAVTGKGTGSWWFVVVNRQSGELAAEVSVVFPRIQGLSVTSAKAGDSVTVTGHDLGAGGKVRVGGVDATASQWTPSAVTFVVPNLPLTSAAEVRLVTSEGARTNGLMLVITQ